MRTASVYKRNASGVVAGGPKERKLAKVPNRYSSVQHVINTGATVRDIEVLSDAKAARLRAELFGRITGMQLAARLRTASPPLLIDLRSPEDFAQGHIANGAFISSQHPGARSQAGQAPARSAHRRKLNRRTRLDAR